jgi:hypothetical protein
LVWRGKGFLVFLLLLPPIFLDEFKQLPQWALKPSQVLGFLLLGAWVVVHGWRKLTLAKATLGRPLKRREWVIDFGPEARMPFHSFMFIQMHWWGIVYLLAAVGVLLN